jgi:siroheme synthase (precorrin-2 oxidase/ferrochelatase)
MVPFIYSAIKIPALTLTAEEQEKERQEFEEYCRKFEIHYNKVKEKELCNDYTHS